MDLPITPFLLVLGLAGFKPQYIMIKILNGQMKTNCLFSSVEFA